SWEDTVVAIITLYKEGYKCNDIATRVGIGVRQVQKWIKKFRDSGGEDIPTPKPRSGRPRKIQNRICKICCAKVLPLLSAKNVRDRIAFSKKYKDWTLEDWEQVLWSDESTFVVSSGCRSKRVRRPKGSDPNDPRYTAKVVKHAPSVMKNWQDASHNVWRRSSSLEENRLANK
ncbi:Transposable element Tc1 transposase-like 8, partial [Homarus americanus]